MATSSQRYSKHNVWESLGIKLESLRAARFGDAESEQWRNAIIKWLTEAQKTKFTRQPASYLGALKDLSAALNELPTADAEFKGYGSVQPQPQNPQMVWALEAALRSLPSPPPKYLKDDYVELLDREIEVRTERLDELEEKVSQTESALQSRRDELDGISDRLAAMGRVLGRKVQGRASFTSPTHSIGARRVPSQDSIRTPEPCLFVHGHSIPGPGWSLHQMWTFVIGPAVTPGSSVRTGVYLGPVFSGLSHS